MIATFWTLALLMCAAATGFILVPLFLRRKDAAVGDRTRANVDIYEERLAELENAQAAGDIDEREFELFKGELQKNLLHDTTGESTPAPKSSVFRFGPLPLALAILVPAFALFAYSGVGLSWGSIADVEFAKDFDETKPHDKNSMAQNIEHLAKRMAKEPDNDQGWFLLAQSYMSLEQYDNAASAFEHLLARYPQDYNLSAYFAQAIFLEDGRQITPRVDAAIEQTLKLNPHDISMWEIRAMDAYNKGEYVKAIGYFRNALTGNPEAERKKMLEQAIAGVERTMKEKGMEVPPAPEPESKATGPAMAMAGGKQDKATPGRRLKVLVEVGDNVQAPANASVFVYARAVNGPPMPLAVQRMSRTDLPKMVSLDDTMGMMQGMSLANFDSVEVIARISSSGIANASPDDYEADSGTIDLTKPQSVIKLKIEHQRKELNSK